MRLPRKPPSLCAQISGTILSQQAYGDQVHIGNGMLESEGDEGANREDDTKELASDPTRGKTHPDRQTHQYVAQDAAEKSAMKGQIHLGTGNCESGLSHSALADFRQAREQSQKDHSNRTDEITDVDQGPVAREVG